MCENVHVSRVLIESERYNLWRVTDRVTYVLGSEYWEDDFAAFSEGVHCSRLGSAETKTIR